MEDTLINDPRAGLIILIFLTVADLIFTRRESSRKPGLVAGHIEYESGESREMGATAYFALVLLKLSPPFLITLVWAAAQASGLKVISLVYSGLLGYAMALYLIVNLGHLETILLGNLAGKYEEDLSGRVFVKRHFSAGQSAVRLFSLLIILAIIFAIKPTPMFGGFALAPATMIIRHIISLNR